MQQPIVRIATVAPVRGAAIERPAEEVEVVFDLLDPHGRSGFCLLSRQRDAKSHGPDGGNDQGHTGKAHGVSFRFGDLLILALSSRIRSTPT